MCSTRSQVRFEEITINSSDMWGKKGFFLNVTSQEMRAMSRLGFSWLSSIHTEFFSQSSPAVPKHSSAFSGQQATVLSKKMFCFLFLTLLWVSPVSDCGHSHHSVGKLNPRLRITAEWWSPVGMKLTGALHWIFCALCALHPDCWLYSLCFQAPEQWGSDLPLRPARGELVGLEERRRWAPGPVRSQSLCLRLQVQQ